MDILHTNAVTLPLTQLTPNEGQIVIDGERIAANPRYITDDEYAALKESIKADNLTGLNPLKVYEYKGQYVVIGGNMRLRAMRELGIVGTSCIIIPQDATAEVLRKEIITDNATFGKWDYDKLANEWDENELIDWGVDLPDMSVDNNYSRKIEAPIYEPTMEECPLLEDCVDTDKYDTLCEDIERANIAEEDKRLLKLAAARHIVFNYANIAERYARADAEVQRLMEDSALVIVDFGKAIENGFVQLTERLKKILENESAT